MAARLGNVIYWLGVIAAALWAANGGHRGKLSDVTFVGAYPSLERY
jgi:hypothetical protein